MNVELHRCPCCGGRPDMHFAAELDNELLRSVYQAKVAIHCTRCHLATPMGDIQDVVSLWNSRKNNAIDAFEKICDFLHCDPESDVLNVECRKNITGERTVTITKWEG